MRKKVGTILYRIFCLVLVAYSLFIVIYHISCDASYTHYNLLSGYKAIKYKGNIYIEGSVAESYELVRDEENLYNNSPSKYYVRQLLLFDFVFPFRYFEFYCESFDDNEFFIINQPNYTTSLYFPFIREDFSYPTVENNVVAEVWMSHISNDKDNIKDKEIVGKIVECAKSDGKKELDKDIVEYIKKHSCDNHCFFLKYEGYPLVEEFHIEKTEDEKYIIDQYTAEEYDTIYWEEQAHQ